MRSKESDTSPALHSLEKGPQQRSWIVVVRRSSVFGLRESWLDEGVSDAELAAIGIMD